MSAIAVTPSCPTEAQDVVSALFLLSHYTMIAASLSDLPRLHEYSAVKFIGMLRGPFGSRLILLVRAMLLNVSRIEPKDKRTAPEALFECHY